MEKQVLDELNEIVGLDEIKQYVLSLKDHYRIQKLRAQRGMKTNAVSMHMIFTGNPGTGKTTIARILSRYLKAIGILSSGQLIEVTRADLVGRYVGHTAPQCEKVIESALGGVLFIDEAYSLYRGKDDSFGLEAIDALVKGIEDHRDHLLVILAGYTKEMQEFLTSNSGLKSRFPNVIEFPDYTAEQLLEITKSIARSKQYVLHAECDQMLLEYYEEVQRNHAQEAGNGRLARNLVEAAILKQSGRCLENESAALDELRAEDFELKEVI
jgi:SpoVK/Ycf46/Vps4 family AAA+-type ATPase